MIILEYDQFIKQCNLKNCTRKAKFGKSCFMNYKQARCYEKYLQSIQKSQIKFETKVKEKGKEIEDNTNFKKLILIRDKICMIDKILSTNEKEILFESFGESIFKNKFLDIIHILDRNHYPQFEFDLDNVFLGGRFFHERLDNYQDLITGEIIGKDGKQYWIERIMKGNNLWALDMSYDKFLEIKLQEKN